ncbi:MAG: 1-(5-phosphoribosyl)-5-[(5-phosphoribosylamino)methylideneamino]imidazole-4-carboxamide isomerase [Leadbetterella sp.]|nr:1-(5-phosphoribosyl)-5-[(5-phosphoribosylamino)methylideneamino]imidazole-4-carboxamide isomerase [Leadbetterella sp.]
MIQIIPAIDIIDGKCVRLTQGDYARKKIYNENPLEVALSFQDAGIQRLHLVDLDGAREKRIINHKVLETLASQTSLSIDFGGGLQSDNDLRIAFESGATQVTGGSIAVKAPDVFLGWLEKFGSERIILGADARDEKIAVSGWQETTAISIFDFLEDYVSKGVKYTISTDVAKDGLLQGPSTGLYRKMSEKFPKLFVIASGGISVMQDILDLDALNIYGVIVGKAIYENRISLKEIEQFYAD